MNRAVETLKPGTVDGPVRFRGWLIVAVGFFAQLLAFGCSIAVYGLFIPMLTTEFGASFMVANLGLSILGVVMALVGVVVGPLLDRRSIRGMMVSGALLNGLAFLAMSQATALWQLAVLFGVVVASGAALFGPLAANTVIAKWFDVHRGRAVGIASMGPPTGGMLLSPLAGTLMASYGWRPTLLVFAALHVLVIPAIWLVIRNRPEDVGQVPDGVVRVPSLPSESSLVSATREWTTSEVLRAPAFWALALAMGSMGAVAGAFNANVIPYAGDIGIQLQDAAFFVSAIGATAIIGTLGFGLLADRVDNRTLFWVVVALQALTFLFLRGVEPSYGSLFGAVLVFGLAAGGLMPLMASAVGQGFGAPSFGRVMGYIGPVTLPFAFLGPPLTGWLRQSTGSYAAAFELFIGVFVFAGIALVWLRLPKRAGRQG
jgi:MFS family permease